MVEVFTTYDPMEASLVKAKLADEGITYSVTGDFDIAMSMEAFNTSLGRIALKRPIKFFVTEGDVELAKTAINTDKSAFLDEDLEY